MKRFFAFIPATGLIVLLAVLFGVPGLVHADLDADISRAITGGQNYLKATQNAAVYNAGVYQSGGWWADSLQGAKVATTAFAVAALLETGVPTTDPAVIGGIHYITSQQQANGRWNDYDENYDTGAALVALGLYGHLGGNEAIFATTSPHGWTFRQAVEAGYNNRLTNQYRDGIADSNAYFGSWTYSGKGSGDLSNTLFGTMGLWYAGRYLGYSASTAQPWAAALLKYLERCHGWDATNPQAWANGRTNNAVDGAFSYGPTGASFYKGTPMLGAGLWCLAMIGEDQNPMANVAITYFANNYQWANAGPGSSAYYYGFFALVKGLTATRAADTIISGANPWVTDVKEEVLKAGRINKLAGWPGSALPDDPPRNYWAGSAGLDGGDKLATAWVLMSLAFVGTNTESPDKRLPAPENPDFPITDPVILQVSGGVTISSASRVNVGVAVQPGALRLPLGAFEFQLNHVPLNGCTVLRIALPRRAYDPADPAYVENDAFVRSNGTLRPDLNWWKISGGAWGGIPGKVPTINQVTGIMEITLCDGAPEDQGPAGDGKVNVLGSPGWLSTISWTGGVVDGYGVPQGGVTVELVGNPSVTTTSGPDGSWTLNGLPGGVDFSIRFSKVGYLPTYSLTVNSAVNISGGPSFSLLTGRWKWFSMGNDPARGMITGRVRDGGNLNRYISGVTLTAVNQSGTPLPVTYWTGNAVGGGSTFKNGIFYVKNVNPGDVLTITASKPGISFSPRTYLSHADGVTMGYLYGVPDPNESAWHTGWVAEANSSLVPTGGAIIRMYVDPTRSTTSNTDGSFTLTGLPRNISFPMRFDKDGFVPTYTTFYLGGNVFSRRPYLLYTRTQLDTLGVPLGKGVIHGRATDARYGPYLSIGGATVTAMGSPSGKNYPVFYRESLDGPLGGTNTFGNGFFYVLNVDPGDTVTLNGAKPGWTFSQSSVTPPATDGVTLFGIAGTATAYITGSVKSMATGVPVPDATVTVRDESNAPVATVTTNEDGYYYAGLGRFGTYSVKVTKPGFDDNRPVLVAIDGSTPNQTATYDAFLTQEPPLVMNLVQGWNFLSLPLFPSAGSIEEALGPAGDNVAVIWGYDNRTKQWLKYRPGGANALTGLESGKGYWFYLTAPAQWTLTGTVPSAVVPLYDGWNLVGWNGTDGTTIDTATAAIAGRWTALWNWTNSQWGATHRPIRNLPGTIQPLTVLNNGKAYWIRIKEGQAADWAQ